jgi:tetratricopeptide (TPR) repeat protein
MTSASLAFRRRPALLALPLAFLATLAVLAAVHRGAAHPAAHGPAAGLLSEPLRPDASTDAQIARLQAEVRAGATNQAAALAAAYLQKVRETGDASYYTRADGILRGALARNPRDTFAVVEAATLAAGRHDFSGALALAQRARALAPEGLSAYPVLVDSLVELGRYGEAESALQQMVDSKPNLSGYARVSYLRELHGDLDGAVDAMRRAIAAGGPVPENVAYVQTLLGGLELERGRFVDARRAYLAALNAMPRYAAAEAGLARLSALRGDLAGAIARWRPVVAALPLPEYVIGLGEAELAAGRAAAGKRDLALVGVEEKLLAAAGVDTDVELAVYEADHGDPARGLSLARRAWAAAPSVRSADALGWALTRSGDAAGGLRWAHRALRLGSVDPLFRYHAGMTALAAGHAAEGRRDLRLALARGLGGHPEPARAARRALERGR